MIEILTPRVPLYHKIMLFLMPDRTVAEAIELKGRVDWAPDFKGKRLPWNRLHVTTNLFGKSLDRPNCLIEDLKAALSEVRFMPFWMGFDWVCSFGARDKRPRVLASGDIGKFQHFRRSVRGTLADAGIKDFLPSKIDPHVTMFYDRRAAPSVRIDTIGWTVREFVLVDSWVGLTRHEILGRWVLNDPIMRPTARDPLEGEACLDVTSSCPACPSSAGARP